jgi:hypothetical protein
MPTLADIYSAINTVKRKGSDFVQNPVTSLQQMVGNANDRARGYNQEMVQAAQGFGAPARGQQATPEQLAAQQSVMDTFAEAYNPAGMVVYHGSPHVFERFDMSKLGTGEGNQAYGRGLYVAQAPEVAKGYQNTLAYKAFDLQPEAEKLGLNLPAGTRGEFIRQTQANKPPEVLARQLQNANIAARELPQDKLTELFRAYQEKGGGNFYKVDLPDTHIRRMLDYDSPLKNQPKPIRNLAKSLGIDLNDLGGDLLAKVGKGDEGKLILQNAGIPGVKYLDEKSRWSPHQVDLVVKGQPYASNQFITKTQAEQYAKEKRAEGFNATYKNVGTKNFVVFDDKHLKILERNPK